SSSVVPPLRSIRTVPLASGARSVERSEIRPFAPCGQTIVEVSRIALGLAVPLSPLTCHTSTPSKSSLPNLIELSPAYDVAYGFPNGKCLWDPVLSAAAGNGTPGNLSYLRGRRD